MNTQTPTQPTTPITDPRFIYRPPVATDVQETWRRFGWAPQQRQPIVQHLPADDTEGGEA